MVGAGSQPEPRNIARDPQRGRLPRRDRRRSFDADSRPRRDHADPSARGVGLAHADPSHVRPPGIANRVLDPMHRDIGRLCELLASRRRLAAADRTWRRRRGRAGAGARCRVWSARVHLSAHLGQHSFCCWNCDLPDRERIRVAPAGRAIDRDRRGGCSV